MERSGRVLSKFCIQIAKEAQLAYKPNEEGILLDDERGF
jgi:hypothetical protein